MLLAAQSGAGAGLELDIRHTFNGEPLLLDSLRYRNAAAETLSVTRLSYLLSGFALEREDGSWLEFTNDAAWIDAGRSRTAIRLDGVLPGAYRSICFHVGLGTNLNHADSSTFGPAHPLNPNLNGLHWSWQGGYVFLAMEGLYRAGATGTLQGYSYHLAREPNRTRINLPAQLELSEDTTVLLDFNLGALLNAPQPLSFEQDGQSTHSRDGDPVAAALVANLPGAFRVRQIDRAAPAAPRVAAASPLYLPAHFTPYRFQTSAAFPIPDLPRDNPLTEERVVLGRKLFQDTALSRDGTISCASCHQEGAGMADSRRLSLGVRGQSGTRHAMPLINLAWKSSFFWDGRAPSLRAQALMPIQDHTEMDQSLTNVAAKLAASKDYPGLFAAAFGAPEVTPEKIGLALEQFGLTLTSFDSRFDQAMRGETRLGAEERRGLELFMTEYDPRTRQYGADCFHCHGGPLFSDCQFHNNGLGVDEADLGRFKVTARAADRGKFATPSLRNVALRAPYMHDGRFRTLEEVVEHYATGVKRSPTLDPNLAKHPDGGVPLSAADKRALVAFLKALTDEKFAPKPTEVSQAP
ncbi:MAG TPA: MbnP family protein [Candidatus Acidoferrum sp.]|nr:MbnP family protein [Candidatus Acidoferrum sp.]